MAEATPEEPLLLTETDAAKHLGFSPRTLQSWRLRGCGPRFVRVSARCIRYRRSELDSWVTSSLRSSTSDEGHAPTPDPAAAG